MTRWTHESSSLLTVPGQWVQNIASCLAIALYTDLWRITMMQKNMFATLTLLLLLWVAPNLYAANCSTAASAGKWAYTYTGTILTPNGPLPVASVGHFTADTAGNLVGSQSRSVAGGSGVEDIAGTFSVNKDCTGTTTVNVLVNEQVQRTAVLALVFDNNQSHARGIFQSLVLPDGTNIPVVITSDYSRVFTKE